MRDKFSELIDAGVASFTYKPVAGNIPEQDDICRMYNNIYSIPSDTHMSFIDGHRYITGHILKNQSKWTNFYMSCFWGGVDFSRTTGSVAKFLTDNGLRLQQAYLNGDVAYEVIPITDSADQEMPAPAICPMCYTTTESQIPQPIDLLTVDHNSLKVKECFEGTKDPYEIAKKLNESMYIKGDNWTVFENKIIGTVSNSNCILKVCESNGEYIRYVLRLTYGPNGTNWIRVESLDEMYDRRNSITINKSTYKYSSSNEYDIAAMDSILKKINSNVVKTLKSLKDNQVYEIYGKDPYDSKMKIRPAKYKHGGALPGTEF